MKTVVQSNNSPGETLSYVKFTEVTPPSISLLNINRSVFPSIFFFPNSTSETWETTRKKVITHSVGAHLVMEYNQRELSIIGDSTRGSNFGKGILDFSEDFITVFRGHRLAVDGQEYLDKPLEIMNVDYFREEMSDEAFFIIATITMQCTRLFLQNELPGNITE